MTTVKTLSELDGQPHAPVFPGEEPQTIRLTLEAGETVAAHSHPDREIVCYLIEGRVSFAIGGETHVLSSGDIARFDGAQEIAPEAVEPSTALLVLAQRSG